MEKWAGLLNRNSSANHAVALGMTRIEDWDFGSNGVGCIADATAGTLAVKNPGVYFFTFTASVTVAQAATLAFEVYKNGGTLDLGAEVKITTANDVEQVTIHGAYMLRPGDVLAVYARGNGSYNVVMRYAQFGIMSV
jgi:hypothetical protein